MLESKGHIESSNTLYVNRSLPVDRHTPGCPCLGCADFRERVRANGITVTAALDWRGVPLPGRLP